MAQKRPGALLAIGALNIVFGSLGLLCSLSSYDFLADHLESSLVAAFDPGASTEDEQAQQVEALVPSRKLVNVAYASIQLLLNGLLVVAGVGLLKMRWWARRACLAAALLAVLTGLAHLLYQLLVVHPFHKQVYSAPGLNDPFVMMLADATIGTALADFVFTAAYPLVLLLLLRLSLVASALAALEAPVQTGPAPV